MSSVRVAKVLAVLEQREVNSRRALVEACGADIRWLLSREPAVGQQLLARIPTSRSPQRRLFDSSTLTADFGGTDLQNKSRSH